MSKNTNVNADFSIAIDGTSDENQPGKVIVNSGCYAGLIGSTGYSYKTLIINGGEFTGFNNLDSFYSKDNPIAKLIITGGTFPIKPDTKFITNGYEAKEVDGNYVITQK